MTDFATIGMDVDSSGLVRGRSELGRLTDAGGRAERGLVGSAGKIGAAWRSAAKVFAALGGALTVAGTVRAVAREVGTFETAMSGVAAVTRATTSDLELMRQTALRLGSTTEFSAAQAADGLRFLGMAGFSASEAVSALPDTLDLATASGMGLAQAADIASNVLSGFGKEARDAGKVADVLAAASSRANTDVAQLGQAMSTVAPISAALGISLEDTAAAIGVLSDAGIQGERAGTALRGIMASLASPTDQARDALAAYGVTIDDVNPATRSLSEIMTTLSEAGIEAGDAMTIFGRQAASGALALQGASERLGEFSTELRDVEGAASDMAGVMRDNLQGDITGLQSAVSGLLIALGDAGLTSAIRGVVQALTAFVRGASLVIGQLSAIAGGVRRLFSEQARLEKQIDNSRIAMNDEARAIAGLDQAMSGGISMSVNMAQQKLNEAMARRENIRAIIEEQRALGMQTSEYKDLSKEIEYTRLQSRNLQNTQRDGGMFAPAANRADMEFQLNQLRELSAAREALLDPSGDTAAMFEQNAQNIERLRAGIAGAVDGMVTFEGQTITTAEATDRLSTAIGEAGGAGGAGAGGGGGLLGGMERLNELLGQFQEQDPRAAIEAWHSEAMTALNEANLIERGMIEEHNAYKLEIERLYQDQLAQIRQAAASQQLGDAAGFFGAMASVAQAGGSRMIKIAQSFSAIQGLINSWTAYTEVLKDPSFIGRPWARFAAAASVLAAGLNAVKTIKSAGSGSGSRPGSSGGASSSGRSASSGGEQQAQQQQAPTTTFQFTLQNDSLGFGENFARQMVEQLNEAQRNGGQVRGVLA